MHTLDNSLGKFSGCALGCRLSSLGSCTSFVLGKIRTCALPPRAVLVASPRTLCRWHDCGLGSVPSSRAVVLVGALSCRCLLIWKPLDQSAAHHFYRPAIDIQLDAGCAVCTVRSRAAPRPI